MNPPIRPKDDMEYLWQSILAGKVDWVVSDHACCSKEMKVSPSDTGDIFVAKSGFGGTEWLVPAFFSEGV